MPFDHLRRREFVALLSGAAALLPTAASAKESARIRRVGWMGAPKDHPYENAAIVAFQQGLSDLGWFEGRNLRIDYRWYAGDGDRYTKDAEELVALAPDAIVAVGGVAVMRLLAITRTVPIVFTHTNDPVARGFVASLARPGGNATGFAHLEYQTSAKWPVLLKQIAPQVTRSRRRWQFRGRRWGKATGSYSDCCAVPWSRTDPPEREQRRGDGTQHWGIRTRIE